MDKREREIIRQLKSKDEKERLKAWKKALNLLRSCRITYKDIVKRKNYLLELLRSDHEDVKLKAWYIASRLLNREILTREELEKYKASFLDLIPNPFSYRPDPRKILVLLYKHSVITKDDIVSVLRHKDKGSRAFIWGFMIDTVDLGLDKTLLKNNKDAFLELLKDDPWVRLESWPLVPILREMRIISFRDYICLKPYLLSLFSHEKHYIRYRAWEDYGYYVRKKILTEIEVMERVNLFTELLESEDLDVRADAWDFADVLLSDGLVTDDDLKERKKFFLELLEKEDEYIRHTAWRAAITLLRYKILESEDLKRHVPTLFKNLENEDVNVISELFTEGVITEKDFKDYKEMFKEVDCERVWELEEALGTEIDVDCKEDDTDFDL